MPDAGDLINFSQALELEPDHTKRHLLLGNGFSRAWREDVFAYDALYEQADLSRLSEAGRRLFDVLGTHNFEAVMKALRTAAKVLAAFDSSLQPLVGQLSADADVLREVLVQTLGRQHPDRPSNVTPDEYGHAKAFLACFKDVYTLNYDLLLYWTLMQDEIAPMVPSDDGFRTPEDGEAAYVTWEVENTQRQNVFYLHGALHVFDGGHEVQKFTWINTQIALIDQIRNALAEELYPIYVSEGESREKLAQIKHSDYLSRAYRSFSRIGGSLYVYGHSMDPADEHIIRLIEKNNCRRLVVGLYGDAASPGNSRIIRRCQQIRDARPSKRPLEVCFFDASTARVWREPPA